MDRAAFNIVRRTPSVIDQHVRVAYCTPGWAADELNGGTVDVQVVLPILLDLSE